MRPLLQSATWPLAASLAIAGIAGLMMLTPASAANQTVAWALPTTSSVTVSVGDTVTWDWGDALPHSVASVSGPATFDSGILTGESQSFAFTFSAPGTYTYRCNVHPSGMTGTVVVEAAATATSTSTATATQPATSSPTQTATAMPATPQPPATGTGGETEGGPGSAAIIAVGLAMLAVSAGGIAAAGMRKWRARA